MDDRHATYDDVAATPEGVRAELIDGELFLQAAPAVDHQVVASRLGADLIRRFHHRDPSPAASAQASRRRVADPTPIPRRRAGHPHPGTSEGSRAA